MNVRMRETASKIVSRYYISLLLTLAGTAVAGAAYFVPWFDVYKLNDPTYPFARRGYSPWMVLQSGVGSLNALAVIYALLIAGLALGSLTLARMRTAGQRSRARSAALGCALVSLTLIIVVVPEVPIGLSFSWPFLSSDIAYGVYLSIAGLLGALTGLVLVMPLGRTQRS